MGLFDDFGIKDILADVSDIGQELRDLKDEVVSAIVDPAQETNETIQDISSELKNK